MNKVPLTEGKLRLKARAVLLGYAVYAIAFWCGAVIEIHTGYIGFHSVRHSQLFSQPDVARSTNPQEFWSICITMLVTGFVIAAIGCIRYVRVMGGLRKGSV